MRLELYHSQLMRSGAILKVTSHELAIIGPVAKKRIPETIVKKFETAVEDRKKAIAAWNRARWEKARAEGKPYAVGAGRKVQHCFCRICKSGGECGPARARRLKREHTRLVREQARKAKELKN